MANTKESTKILLLSKNPAVIQSTREYLSEEGTLELVEKEVTAGNMFTVIETVDPDVILLDFNFQPNPFNLVDQVVSESPTSSVIAILPDDQVINLDRVVLSGARAFVKFPYEGYKLPITIKRVMELQQRNGRSQESTAGTKREKFRHTYTIFGPKGGAGTSTIAVNLAIALHDLLDEELLLIDGKHLFGHLSLYLNLRTGNSVTDLIAHAGSLDERLIKQVVVEHTSGITVLPSPTSISEAQGIRPESLFTVLQALQGTFENILVDAGSNLNENTVTYMDSSDKILLVLNPDLASMRDARQFLEVASTLSYPKDKILLILNQAGRKADIKSSEIEDILKVEIFATIPADENIALTSLNEGVPVILKKSRHPISRAIKKMAKDLVKIRDTSISE
jgi:pilus assembly protein CpaE